MTQVSYKLKLGQDEFTLNVEVANPIELFEKLSFYSNLPKTGPGGEDDLKITHRTTTEGYNYYSLVSEKAGMEYKFGQPKENPKALYGKGWEPLFKKDGETAVAVRASAPIGVQAPLIGQPQATQQQTYIAPVAGPTPVADPQVVTTPQQIAQPISSGTALSPNPQTAAIANNVLARFGIPAKPQ